MRAAHGHANASGRAGLQPRPNHNSNNRPCGNTPAHLQGQAAGPLPALRVSVATTPAEFRAAGYLRAYSFYAFPPDRSEFAARVRGPR